jgi:hypothetical protein
MYITSDLFGGNTAYNHRDTVNSPYWAAMADSTHTAGLGKRKRLEGEDGHSAYGMPPIGQQDSGTDFD